LPTVRISRIDGAPVTDEVFASLPAPLYAQMERPPDGSVVFAFPFDAEVDAKSSVELELDKKLPDWHSEVTVSVEP
jgi:hypothetical protein